MRFQYPNDRLQELLPSDAERDASCLKDWMKWLQSEMQESEEVLWNRYFRYLRAKARGNLLATHSHRPSGIEQFAVNCLFVGTRESRFPSWSEKGDLWKPLLWQAAQHVLESDRGIHGHTPHNVRFRECLGLEPSAQIVQAFAKLLVLRLSHLPDARTLLVARLFLEGTSSQQIGEILNLSSREVAEQLEQIRLRWQMRSGEGLHDFAR
ncbi:ECF-type sigma factor [Bremerella sp. T1]|uniref:ECF-type sigma factor n=1 Tax=Bremerella sp. TYQ1 TaxID=3119568 RepID=UPI001CCA3D18|nr:ECF-type sigma factor [Bremerella volcania]UBM35000.1 hypothetical protein LA756_20215 [Bremerella volcania]